METVHIALPGRSYDVLIGEGILDSLGKQLPEGLGRRCAVVTDSTVGPLYGELVLASLRDAGKVPVLVTVPAGEASKSMTVVSDVCGEMIRAGLDRQAFVVALGGGVVGDLAGFVASIFFRGVPYIQVPTTVVSQVDSSVGGKTGVNTAEGKNLLGAFHQPKLVLADVKTLHSLPEREYNEGYAEIIKHAAIRDAEMFPMIESLTDREGLIPLIKRNVEIKAAVVIEDEKETSGTRALLNFGHTIGHAIEASAGYGELLHGEAISLGLVAAARLSRDLDGLGDAGVERILDALKQFKLPLSLNDKITDEQIRERMARDKKFEEGEIRFVLLHGLGDAFVSKEVTMAEIDAAVAALR